MNPSTLRWVICKLCGRDIHELGHTQITHMRTHGYKGKGRQSYRGYFTSREYLT